MKAPRHWFSEGSPTVTDGFPSQRVSNAEIFSFDDVIIDFDPTKYNIYLVLENEICYVPCECLGENDRIIIWTYTIWCSENKQILFT